MKKVFLPAILASILTVGCWKDNSSTDSNQANLGIVSNTGTNQEITAKPANTPLPVFTDANEALAVGDKLFDQSDNEMAIEAYRQAVKLSPDFAEAYFKLGMAYSQLEIEQKDAGVLTEDAPTPVKKGKKGNSEIERRGQSV